MRPRVSLVVRALLFALAVSSVVAAQAPASPTQTAVALHPDLLPLNGFGLWKAAGSTPAALEPPYSLVNANKAALEECSPQRSAVQTYAGPGGRTLHVEAVELRDASGALAAYSVLSQPGMRDVKDLGQAAEITGDGVTFLSGNILVVAFPATSSDLPTLRALTEVLPRATGSAALRPLLPSLLPSRGLVAGSLRYALGPRSYMAEGGVLPAAGLGWDKDAEAVTARYSDRRGAETLTLLLYPTPTIAGPHLRALEGQLPGMGASLKGAKTRREGSLLAIANGSFTAEAAQNLVENAHLHQIATTDKAMPTPEVIETKKTFGLLANIILFAGVLGAAAITLGLFLGGGRALVRVLRGKPAATETEFLSLHLDPQNPAPLYRRD